MAEDSKQAKSLPTLVRYRGIGTMMVGRFDHPDVAPGCYRQFAVVIFYIPIWFGPFYALKAGPKGDGTLFIGPFTGRDMVARYGLGAYWRFKLGVTVVPLIALAVFAALQGRAMWMRAHPMS